MTKRKEKTKVCPGCGGAMNRNSKHCRGCNTGGRKPHAYAMQLGISTRRMYQLGGEARLQAMSDDARAILLKPARYGSKSLQPSLVDRGYVSKKPGRVTQAQGGRRWTA